MCEYIEDVPTVIISEVVRHIAATLNSDNGVAEVALIQAAVRLDAQALEIQYLKMKGELE